MLTNQAVPYDLGVKIPISRLLTMSNAYLALCLNSVLNVKALEGAFNQEKTLAGAFSVIVQLSRLIICSTNYDMLNCT